MRRAEATLRVAHPTRDACARVAAELHAIPAERSRRAARTAATRWKETTLLELVWGFCERIDDDAAVVAAVTDLVRRGSVRSEDGRWYELEVTP
jgi:hypothetical protein